MNSVLTQPCPLCGSINYKFVREFDDKVVVGECMQCHALYTPMRHPNPESLLSNRSFEELVWLYTPVLNGTKKHYRINSYQKYINTILKYSKGKRLLDVGCAHGFFPFLASKSGFEATGIEFTESFARFGNECLKVPIMTSKIEDVDLKEEKWDVISFTDSIEYFPDPITELKKLSNNLTEKGIIFIKVPNGQHFSFRWSLSKLTGVSSIGRSAFTPSLRNMHYDLKSLVRLVKLSGLNPISVGSSAPIDSPPWYRIAGYNLETMPPWWMDIRRSILRRLGQAVGKIEELIFKNNHFSSSLYIVAEKK